MASNPEWKWSCFYHNKYKWHDQGLHKGYDMFQTLLSQLKIHGTGVSHEDANQKFLRSLPSFWSQVALIMRTKPGLDTLSFDDLYNNLRVLERDVKGTTASSSSNTQNVTMISMRIKKFYKRKGKKLQFDTRDTVGFDKTKVDCFNCHKMRHFTRDYRAKGNQDSRRRDGGYNGNKARDNGRRPAYQDDSKALVSIDGEAIDWPGHVEEDTQNFAMMAYSSSNSGSDNESVFINKCDLENTHVNDRYVEGMHTVPPPMTGNYMPSGPDVEIDYSKFIYGPKQTSADESDSKPVEYASSNSDSSVETTTSMSAPVDNAPKIVCEPKVWTDTPVIEEYKSDSDDDSVHLIRDCDFHEKTMTKQAALTKSKEKGTGQQAHRPVWNNVKRVNHQNKFVPSVLLTKTSKIPVNAARQNFSGQAALTSTASKVNTARPFNDPHNDLKDKGIIDSGCSRHMSGNKAHHSDYQEFKGGSVTFRCSNGRITGKGKIKTGRLGHMNFKNLNKLVKVNLVRDLPFKIFENDHTCVACQKGKQNKVSCKAKTSAERKNRTLIEAARTMLAYSFLPTKFWAEAVNTACYVLNREELEKLKRQEKKANDVVWKVATHETQDVNTNLLNVVSTPVSVVGPTRALNDDEPSYPDDPSMPHFEDIYASPSAGIFTDSSYDDEGVVTDFNNLETTVTVSPTPTTRIHTIHPKTQILRDPLSAV
nr:ribonuclease H-like domain-containing protein [Tanacetum cinerariifolium]